MARFLRGGAIVVRHNRSLIISYPGGLRVVTRYRSRLAAIIAYWKG